MASRKPAWIIQRRVRETSAGDSGMALLRGSRACSIRSRMAGLFSTGFSCWLPRARRRAPSMELGVTAAAPKANTAATTVKNTTMIRTNCIVTTLNLNPDDLTDHKISYRLQRNTEHQERMTDRVREERMNETGIQTRHHGDNDRRHTH